MQEFKIRPEAAYDFLSPGLLQPSHVLRQALARKANSGAQLTPAAGEPVSYVKGKSGMGVAKEPW